MDKLLSRGGAEWYIWLLPSGVAGRALEAALITTWSLAAPETSLLIFVNRKLCAKHSHSFHQQGQIERETAAKVLVDRRRNTGAMAMWLTAV